MLRLKIPPPIVAGSIAIMMHFLAQRWPQALFEVPGGKPLGLLLALLGILIAGSGVWLFRQASTTIHPGDPERTRALVQTGVYRFSRNPMYLGVLCTLLALACYQGHGLNLLWGPLGFALYLNAFQIGPEEELLEAKFKQAYVDYKQRVRRWL